MLVEEILGKGENGYTQGKESVEDGGIDESQHSKQNRP
jgi:hypothetical protein